MIRRPSAFLIHATVTSDHALDHPGRVRIGLEGIEKGVSVGPGATQLMQMPELATSRASASRWCALDEELGTLWDTRFCPSSSAIFCDGAPQNPERRPFRPSYQ